MGKSYLYEDWLNTWLDKKVLKVKNSTFSSYKSLIENQVKPYLGNLDISKLSDVEIQMYIFKLKDAGLSDKTIRDIISLIKASIKSFYKEKGITPSFLEDIKIPGKKNKLVEVFSNEEQEAIIDEVFRHLNKRTLGIAISLLAGLRIGEVCGLQWKDIDFLKGEINISKTVQRISIQGDKKAKTKIIVGTPKTNSSNRVIPIANTLYNLLRAIRESDLDIYIVSGKLEPPEPRAVRGYFSRFLKSIGIRNRNFHCLRHSFATKWIRVGEDIKYLSKILGHSSVKTTYDLYVHPTMDDLQKATKSFDEKWHF